MTVRVVTAPAYEPVTRAQAKLWAKLDADLTADDAIIDLLVKTMREYAENLTGRAFVQRTLQYIMPATELLKVGDSTRTGFKLPFPPLISVSSITYIDTDGVQQTLAAADYDVHTWVEPGIVVEDWNASWPSYRGEPDAWRINYLAGYAPGSPPDEAAHQEVLPAALKVWVQARIATLYNIREQVLAGNFSDIPRDYADGRLDALIIGERLF